MKLKPCPFCGKTESVVILALGDKPKPHNFTVGCPKGNAGCGAQIGPEYYRRDAIKVWNRRTEPEAKDENP